MSKQEVILVRIFQKQRDLDGIQEMSEHNQEM